MKLWADAVWGVIRRDALVFVTYRMQVLSQVFGMLFQLTIFYFISRLVQSKTFSTPEAYFAFVVVGLAIMEVLVTTLGLTPGKVRQELVAGTMERFIVSPFGATNGVIAMMCFPIAWALLSTAVLLGLAAAIFGLHVASTAPIAVPVAVLGSLAFMPFALAIVAAVIAFKQATAGTQFATAGIAIIGGLFFPTRLLPGWIRWASDVQPFTPAADLMRHLLVGSSLQHPALAELLKLVGFAIVLFPVTLFLVRRAMLYGQRRGTIIEY
jgi:ABC-type uncharacterized transport system permease subunit